MSLVDDQLIERLSELPDTKLISEIESLKLEDADIHRITAGLAADRFVQLLKLLPAGTARFLLSKSNSQRLTDIMYELPDSALPSTTLKQLVTRLAQTADRTSQTNFLHYAFAPDHNVMELGAKHINEVWSGVPQSTPVLQPAPELCHNLNGDGPVHRLLIGDNFHALAGIQAFYAARPSAGGAYDLVYIDPPYNTGRQDMTYDDKFVGEDDPFRHTKWMSFMEPRLILARDLMKESGVILISIGEDEMHTLKTMCDSIFGRTNFIASAIWDGTTVRNDATYVSSAHDYLLMYAKTRTSLAPWIDKKPGVDDVNELVDQAWEASRGDPVAATNAYRALRRSLPPHHPARIGGMKMYDSIDKDGRLYRLSPVSAPEARASRPVYEVVHPVTGRAVKTPRKGWRWDRGRMERAIQEGIVVFGRDETFDPQYKLFLDEHEDQKPSSVFKTNKGVATSHVENVLGKHKFNNPKDHTVLARWFRMAAPKDAKILDFFGGSGSTAEAVLLLNQQDGGAREVTIITNNDVDAKTGLRIGTDITRERIVRVMTGEEWADGKPHTGYGGRLLVQRVGTTPLPVRRPVYESEHHRMDGVFGQWAAWMYTPLLKESTDAYMVFTNADDSEHAVVYHNIDALNGGLVDEVVDRFPGATTFMPTYASRSSVRFYVDDVPNAVAHPAPARDIIDKAVRNAVYTPYTRRGATNLNTVRTVLLEAIRKSN